MNKLPIYKQGFNLWRCALADDLNTWDLTFSLGLFKSLQIKIMKIILKVLYEVIKTEKF